MPSLFKSAVLGFGLLAGVGVAAHAQSVSALPPTRPATGQIVTPPPSSTTQSFFPQPGGNQSWEEQHYRPNAGYDADAAQHPYSTLIGPKPGAIRRDRTCTTRQRMRMQLQAGILHGTRYGPQARRLTSTPRDS